MQEDIQSEDIYRKILFYPLFLNDVGEDITAAFIDGKVYFFLSVIPNVITFTLNLLQRSYNFPSNNRNIEYKCLLLEVCPVYDEGY